VARGRWRSTLRAEAESWARSMINNWVLFVPGVLLLLLPADRLLSRLVELRSYECFKSLNNSPRYRPWWWVPALWIDPARAYAGTWLLLHAMGLETVFWTMLPKAGYGVLLAVIAVGVLGQTFTRRGGGEALLAPIGYVGGVVAALTSWPLASIGLLAAMLGVFAFRGFYAFFVCGAFALPLLGVALGEKAFWLVPMVVALVVPLVTSWISGCSLELPTRDDSAARPVAR
jgi:hypothetical protein